MNYTQEEKRQLIAEHKKKHRKAKFIIRMSYMVLFVFVLITGERINASLSFSRTVFVTVAFVVLVSELYIHRLLYCPICGQRFGFSTVFVFRGRMPNVCPHCNEFLGMGAEK